MLVYGDIRRVEEPRRKAEAIGAGLASLASSPTPPISPIERHALLAGLLIEAGELEQGLRDAALPQNGEERRSPAGDAASRLTRAMAELLRASFEAHGAPPADQGLAAAAGEALAALLAGDLPATVEVSVPEGYAFYGLYPETYLAAATAAAVVRSRGEGPWKVIGLRSIGTGLAALAAAALGDGASVVTVRPSGHPFARRIAVGPELERELLGEADPPGRYSIRYAVVDEGPGLSGSSFGCVADWLEERGVRPAAIAFFPSHRGAPGPYAGERHRRRWERSERHVADFEPLFASPDARWPLAGWVADLTGEATGPLAELSAGRWREKLFPDPARWPAADVRGERRKYLLTARGGRWLLKLAGLGRYGRETLALARTLSDAGLIPPVAGLRHGFLVGPWLEDARPLPLAGPAGIGAETLLDAVASYLAFRASRFPAAPRERGATPDRLCEMLVHNVGLALGPEFAAAAREWQERLPEIARLERPVLTDNKLHAWEWLVTAEGKLLKADALDHHRGNDLVGPQDVAWDLAGAAVELGLDGEPLRHLAALVARRAGLREPAPVQLAFYEQAYLAFQLGRHTLAAEALDAADPAEAARLRAEVERYAERLRRTIPRGLGRAA